MKPLSVALYYPWIYLRGGVERSMLELLKRSGHNWTIYTSRYEPENTFEEFKDFEMVFTGKTTVKRDMASVLKSTLSVFTVKVPAKKHDAFAVWCDGIGTMTNFRNSNLPSINICSTPLRPVYDPVYACEALKSRKPMARACFRILKNGFREFDRMAWKRFDRVIATSEEVKSRIIHNRLYPDNSNMLLRHPGIDVSQAPSNTTHEPFFLVPGRISWTKNISLAIKAFLKADLPDPWKLVIAGFLDEKSKAHFKDLKALSQNHPRIEFIVRPDDEELNDLYRRCYAMMFTPLNEDWGMTPLEAMLRSKPVMAVNSGGPLESIENDETGWLLPPNPETWAQKIKEIITKPEEIEYMGKAALRRVHRYDWSQFVGGIDNAISSMVEEAQQSALSLRPART